MQSTNLILHHNIQRKRSLPELISTLGVKLELNTWNINGCNDIIVQVTLSDTITISTVSQF